MDYFQILLEQTTIAIIGAILQKTALLIFSGLKLTGFLSKASKTLKNKALQIELND